VDYAGAGPYVEDRLPVEDCAVLGAPVVPWEAADLRDEESSRSLFVSLSVCEWMLLGFLGGVLGGLIVAGATDSGGFDFALDVEYCAVVGLALGTIGAVFLAVARRLLRRLSPQP
jgi:hypothetical protein